jgi:multiple antibiotic resistance protein
MLKFIESTISSFAALFPVTDPLGAIPIFLVLAAKASQDLRQNFALKTALYFLLVLVVFLFIGGSFLSFFGISIAGVKIAGGIVISEAGWQALKEESTLSQKDTEEATEKVEHHEDISFIPMTIPLLAGPGAIAVTIGLAAQAGEDSSVPPLLNLSAIILSITVIAIIVYFCLRLSNWFLEKLGNTGITAISRLLGLFILAFGIQLILNGVADWVGGLPGN